MREVSSQSGYCGQNSLNVEFGLGNSSIIDSIIVKWSSGIEEIFTDIDVNQFISITENDGISSSQNFNNGLPLQLQLDQNYPNPFNPLTKIRYALNSDGNVVIMIHNSLGERISTLIDEYQGSGKYEYEWGGINDSGQILPSGIYYCRLIFDGYTQSIKMLLLK